MHRGSHHFGNPFDSAYSRRGYHNNEDNMIEIVTQFREFKPYLKKRLAFIRQSGRALELQDEVEDIEFYLEVMKDILADESHGVDQLKSFIDKIHEMIRKNPLTDLPNKRRSLEGNDDVLYGDNDRPRSPSPETRGSGTAANIPLIPTHGAHRTVEVNFASQNEHGKPPKKDDYDEWGGSSFENSFTRREPYKDVDMRGGGYYQPGAAGRGQRRWSEEGSDYSGARSVGVSRGIGLGRGAGMPHHRQDQDIRHGRGRGFNDNDYDRRNDYYNKERERDLKPPDWFTGGGGGPSNGNNFDEWQTKSETRDNCFRTDVDRRAREDEWRMNHSSETRERDDKFHTAQHIAKYFERRPSSERREERNEDYNSMFDRRPRNDRSHDSGSSRHDPHSDRRGHGGDFHGRGRKDDDRHDARSRMDGGPQQYPPPGPSPGLMNPMTSIPITPQPSMGYGVPQPPPHYSNTGLLPPPTSFPNVNPPLLPLPVQTPPPNVGMGLGMQHVQPPMGPGPGHSMGFQQPPPTSNYGPDIHSNRAGYQMHPSNHHQSRPPIMSPPPMRPPVPHHPPEHYQGVPSGSPNYSSPVEPSAEQVREITMMKAKQCFGRVVSRSPSGSSTQSSTMTSVSPGPTSPNNSGKDQNSTLDPRLNRSRPGGHHIVQNRQQSPPNADHPPRNNQRPDAGNVLRPSSDPRARSRIEQERKRLQETRDRVRQHEVNKANNNNKGSKIQELRKQFEKEGFHRLGRPVHKKQGGSFEDAISAPDEEAEIASAKPGDKSKSPSSSHSKEKEADTRSKSRSQTDKTDREKSPKKKGGDKSKGKEKGQKDAKSTNNVDKRKDKESTNERTSPRKKSGQNDKSGDKGSSQSSKTSKSSGDSDTSDISEKIPDPTKPPAFKIPRKPKPKEPEVEPPPSTDDQSSEAAEKNVCTSPPASPEPALSQVPDTESRIEVVDDTEMPSSSAKSTTEESPAASSDVNPNTLEKLKQFILTSADPDERDFFMSNPDTLKQFFFKIKSEMSAAKGKTAEDSAIPEAAGDTEQEQEQDKVPPPEEDVPERGRSREKKKNTKRRSSLEKLHDALKEMRFDTMLPLGPRRCTRGVQEEVTTETTVESETTTNQSEEQDESKAASSVDKQDSESEKSLASKKRGRPPKESPKSKKSASKASVTEEEPEIETIETDSTEAEVVVEEKAPARRGKKRKIKPAKASPRKRVKKSGPITRAQAALKNKPKAPATPKENTPKTGVTTRKKNPNPNNVILRRLTRKRVGPKDVVVNQGLGKIKLESDFIPSVKTEPAEADPFLTSNTNESNNDQSYLADQLADIINENLGNDVVANLDKQTEENMDLDVFNTLDGDDNPGEVLVKDEMDISLEEEASSELSYEGTMVEPSSGTPKKSAGQAAATKVAPPTISSPDEVVVPVPDTNQTAPSLPESVPQDTVPSENNTTPLDSASTDTNTSKDLDVGNLETVPNSTTDEEKQDSEAETDAASILTTSDDGSSTKQVSANKAQSSRKTSSVTTPEKDPLLLGEDDTSCLSASSSSSAPAFKSEPIDNKPVKTEPLDSSSEFAGMEDLRKDVFSNRCDKCNFSGKKIVAHYVNKHYPCNIPQARLMPETFNGLIELNTSESQQLLEIVLDESQLPVWPCLYCDDRYDCIVDFYDHLTSHTGEFRYECGECGTSYPHHKSLINHVKIHKGVSKNCVRFTFESVIEKTSKELSGFLCNDCFYFQLRFESIIRHIEQTGHSSLDVKSVRLIRPSANAGEQKVAIDKVPKQEAKDSEGVEVKVEPTEDSLVAKITEVNEKENECVFFGTNANFTPPSVPTGEVTFTIPRVFDDIFLKTLMKKVELVDENKSEGSRKRKRGDESSNDVPGTSGGAVVKSEDLSQASDANPDGTRRAGVKIRKTYSKRKTKLQWDTESEESLGDEPNNFLLSSDDDSSDESDWSDCIDDLLGVGGESGDGKHGSGKKKVALENVLNNEHIVKTRSLKKIEKWDEEYFRKHQLTTLRRPGDLYSPNTVLFGFIRAGLSKSAPHKLRDHKEVDKLSHVYGARVLPVKCMPKLKEMITNSKLLHLFKCMSTVCSYTTDHPGDFLDHLTMNHFTNVMLAQEQSCARFLVLRDVVMMKDADCCAYCGARYRDARDLVDHIINQHSQSPYQCNRCFYRSFYHRYVVRHFDLEHPGEHLQVLKCHMTMETQTEEATLFQIFVYKCDVENPKCDKTKRFVFREDFTEHLEKCGPGLPDYPCHLCKTSFPLEDLIEHYKTHNLFKFHCSYCAFGSEVKTDLDEHFVLIHPNTSGRVFYRVKPSPTSTAPKPIFPVITKKSEKSSRKKSSSIEAPPITDDMKNSQPVETSDKDAVENQANADTSGMDVSENEDNEKGRVTNLRGRDLYRCVTGDCNFIADNSDRFKEHVNACTLVAESRSLSCAHCERKMKTATNLLEHMKVHGEKKHACSLCTFRCWTSAEITKHIKTVHRVMSHKLIKKEVTDVDPDPDLMAYPKDVMTKSLCSAESFENNYYSYAKKAIFSLDNVDKLPLNKIFSSDLNCSQCPYSTKVRSNLIRHLNIHKQAKDNEKIVVPLAQRINPVPYLNREGLEFDKMMNLAASSHKTDGGPATEREVKKLPQFVKEQFRYVCSVCDHITSDDTLLQTHVKVIHSEVSTYKCPHCQKIPESKDNPDNTVPLDKIAFHLRLHGPKLYKCGHCMVVHHQLRLMEKHIPEKHPEKKPIHYLIRDVDPDGIPSARPTTSGANRRQSADDAKSSSTESWKCFLCSSKSIFGGWNETKAHCEAVHKVSNQFMCLGCGFLSDDVTEMLTHCRQSCKEDDKKKKILVMFSKCETFDAEDASQTAPVWKKNAGPVRHIHGNFTEDSVALIRLYNSLQNNEQLPASGTSPLRSASLLPLPMKSQVKTTTAATSKARRSIGGQSPSKANSVKGVLPPPPIVPQSPQKSEVFKYRCHKCDMYRTKNPTELRIHLYNEYRYKRWMCLVCNTKFTTEKSLKGHIERDHQKVYQNDLYELQPENIEIEGEIDECIEKQNRKKDMINSFAIEKFGKLSCKHCKEDGYTYDTFETHILQKHSS